MNFLQVLVDGTAIGMLYGLIAMGMALIFGVMGLINLAHGELITVGAFTIYATQRLPLTVSIILAFVIVALLALIMERVAFRPLVSAPPATAFAMTFAVGFAIRSVIEKIWTDQGQHVPTVPMLQGAVTIGPVRFTHVEIAAIVVGGLLLAAVASLLRWTMLGLQMQAVAVDIKTAQLVGINTNRVIQFVFILAGLLATAGMLMFTVQNPVVTPGYGLQLILIAIVGVVIGGLGQLWAACLGGFTIGLAQSVIAAVLPSSERQYLNAALFTLVIILLLIRPAGLFLRKAESARV